MHYRQAKLSHTLAPLHAQVVSSLRQLAKRRSALQSYVERYAVRFEQRPLQRVASRRASLERLSLSTIPEH